jgi:hypothetical protein
MRSEVTIDEQLAYAIEHRRQLAIRYVADPASRGLRVINPHVVFTASTGALSLHAVQVAGHSSSGLTGPAWRSFDLSRVWIAEVLESGFEVDDELNLANRDLYPEIHLAVTPPVE